MRPPAPPSRVVCRLAISGVAALPIAAPVQPQPLSDDGYSTPALTEPPQQTARWFQPLEFFVAGGTGDEGEVFALHVGTEWELDDRFALAPQFVLGATENTDDKTSLLTGFDLMGRWTVQRGEHWRLFIEGGAGVQYVGPESMPRRGTHANFRLRGGVGAQYTLNDSLSLLGGVNWLHFSNADVLEPNNGHDGPMYYLGLRREF